MRSWPHPVVSPLCDDVAPNAFDFRLDVLPEHHRWILGVEVTAEDATLANYVQAGKACYLLHVECKRTNYRGTLVSSTLRFEMSIGGDLLFGLVEVSLLVVAKKDLEGYRHPGQHADYRNSAFDINPGEPLAVAASKTFDAFLEVDPILKLSSILDIKRGEDDLRRMQVSCFGDRILIELPLAEFDRYRELRADPPIRGLLATTVVLPALLDAFFYLRTPDLDLDEFKANHRWCRCVLNRLERLKVDLVNPNAESGICLEAAQMLLREPLQRGLEDLSQLYKT
ncbi:MAG: hypothetical protein PHC88_08510 [Terrimicrobiaceae bacterium]|nr:hypothetical protein [Terrimicrobiaceae bacterium]